MKNISQYHRSLTHFLSILFTLVVFSQCNFSSKENNNGRKNTTTHLDPKAHSKHSTQEAPNSLTQSSKATSQNIREDITVKACSNLSSQSKEPYLIIKTPKDSTKKTTNHFPQSSKNKREQRRNSFIQEARDDSTSDLELNNQLPSGVALIILCQDQGKTCVLLGRERGGPYANKLNFIGGKCSKDHNEDNLVQCLGTLYDEVREELGLHLQYAPFKKSLIQLVWAKQPPYNSALFFCHITEIAVKDWKTMDTKRKAGNFAWKYQEFAEIKYIPVEELATHNDISNYVSQNIMHIKTIAKAINDKVGISKNEFIATDDNVPMIE